MLDRARTMRIPQAAFVQLHELTERRHRGFSRSIGPRFRAQPSPQERLERSWTFRETLRSAIDDGDGVRIASHGTEVIADGRAAPTERQGTRVARIGEREGT